MIGVRSIDPTRLGRWSRGALAAVGGVLLALPSRVDADDRPPPSAIWTNEPISVDRSSETRERLPPVEALREDAGSAWFTLKTAAFPMLGDDGSFNGGGRRWIIVDVALPSSSKICATDAGGRWACGIRVRALYSRLLTAATLKCSREASRVEEGALAGCRIRGVAVVETVERFEAMRP